MIVPYRLSTKDPHGRPMTWNLYSATFQSPDGRFGFHFYAISDDHAVLQLEAIKETAELDGQVTTVVPVREMRDEPVPLQPADPLRAALQLALEATPEELPAALNALRQQLGMQVWEPVAARYDFDGYGWRYIDDGSGSDWQTRKPDAELVYVPRGGGHGR